MVVDIDGGVATVEVGAVVVVIVAEVVVDGAVVVVVVGAVVVVIVAEVVVDGAMVVVVVVIVAEVVGFNNFFFSKNREKKKNVK